MTACPCCVDHGGDGDDDDADDRDSSNNGNPRRFLRHCRNLSVDWRVVREGA